MKRNKRKQLFAIGQVALAITSPLDDNSQLRVKGEYYSVADVGSCLGCNTQFINIGGKANGTKMKCPCGNILFNGCGLAWTNSKHFLPITDKSLSVLIRKEEYILAAKLRDVLKEHVEEKKNKKFIDTD
jgi:hypothetical protein